MQLELTTQTKAERIKQILINAGDKGVTNATLNHISFRYSSVIHRLRNQGYEIITGSATKSGLVTYYYIRKDEV